MRSVLAVDRARVIAVFYCTICGLRFILNAKSAPFASCFFCAARLNLEPLAICTPTLDFDKMSSKAVLYAFLYLESPANSWEREGIMS